MAQRKGALEGRTAQVEVAVLGPQVLAAVALLLDGEGRDGRFVQNADGAEFDLNVAGGHLGILALALEHLARGLDHEFAAQPGHGLADCGFGAVIDAELRDAVTVADVHETHTAHPAAFLYPSRQGHGLTHVAETKFTTSMCPVHIDYKLGRFFFRECIIRLPRASSAAHLK